MYNISFSCLQKSKLEKDKYLQRKSGEYNKIIYLYI